MRRARPCSVSVVGSQPPIREMDRPRPGAVGTGTIEGCLSLPWGWHLLGTSGQLWPVGKLSSSALQTVLKQSQDWLWCWPPKVPPSRSWPQRVLGGKEPRQKARSCPRSWKEAKPAVAGVPGMFLPGCPLWAWCFAAIAHLTLVELIAGGIGTSFLQLTKLRYTVFCCV